MGPKTEPWGTTLCVHCSARSVFGEVGGGR